MIWKSRPVGTISMRPRTPFAVQMALAALRREIPSPAAQAMAASEL